MTAASAIDVASLGVRAGGREILAVDRLTVPAGQVVTLLGANGAGKSTLVKTVLGFLRPARGRVVTLGREVTAMGAWGRTRLRRKIGYVPQHLAGRSEMPLTLRDVVAIGRTGQRGLLRPLTRDDRRCVDDWLGRLGLADLADQPYGDLSGGEQRRGLLAKAMVQQPQLLALDEPTANLDLAGREAMLDTLGELLASVALTVVLVCHELEAIPPACGRVVMLEAGRVVADGPPDEVLTGEQTQRLYGRRLGVLRRGGRFAAVPTGGEKDA
jgi:ABC-type Mn2+/Zn2+ transport system ATPase subunit